MRELLPNDDREFFLLQAKECAGTWPLLGMRIKFVAISVALAKELEKQAFN